MAATLPWQMPPLVACWAPPWVLSCLTPALGLSLVNRTPRGTRRPRSLRPHGPDRLLVLGPAQGLLWIVRVVSRSFQGPAARPKGAQGQVSAQPVVGC